MKILRTVNIILLSIFVLMVVVGLAKAAPTCTLLGEACAPGDHNCDACTAEVSGTTTPLANAQAAVDATARGGTVTIPESDTTWTGTLVLDRSITLQGAGKTLTHIRSGLTVPVNTESRSSTYYLVYYSPASIASDTTTLLRITGIHFDMNYRSGGIQIRNRVSPYTTPLYKLRIDNNDFTECWDGQWPSGIADDWNASTTLTFYGAIYGVVDSNTFSGFVHTEVIGQSRDSYDETVYNYTHGTANSLYFEDNTITNDGTNTLFTQYAWWLDNGLGGNWVARYNTLTNSKASTAKQYATYNPHHGSSVEYASKGGEFYGNQVTHTAGTGSFELFGIRGGKNLVFYNQVSAASASGRYIYYSTATAPTDHACTTSTLRNGLSYCAADGQPQDLYRTYTWNNRYGTTLIVGSSTSSTLRQDIDYINPKSTCTPPTCASGIGCGTTLPTYCSTGTGYWITTQSCENTTNMVGPDPTTPIAGTMYRCASTDNWQAYYTPYAYPHPLRGEADTTAPTVSNISPTTEQACNDESDPYTASSHAISFNTNENATCRYTIGTTEAYADLDTEFTGAGTTSHSGTVALTCGQDSTIYYACTDGTNVSDTASWTFGVSAADDTDAPILNSLTVTNQSCSTTQLLRVQTSEPATCRYCKDDGDACTSATVWASRTQMTQTVDTQHSEVSISQACSATETYNILCQDTNENESTNLAVSITTDAAKAMSITVGGAHTITLGSGGLSITVIP